MYRVIDSALRRHNYAESAYIGADVLHMVGSFRARPVRALIKQYASYRHYGSRAYKALAGAFTHCSCLPTLSIGELRHHKVVAAGSRGPDVHFCHRNISLGCFETGPFASGEPLLILNPSPSATERAQGPVLYMDEHKMPPRGQARYCNMPSEVPSS